MAVSPQQLLEAFQAVGREIGTSVTATQNFATERTASEIQHLVIELKEQNRRSKTYTKPRTFSGEDHEWINWSWKFESALSDLGLLKLIEGLENVDPSTISERRYAITRPTHRSPDNTTNHNGTGRTSITYYT